MGSGRASRVSESFGTDGVADVLSLMSEYARNDPGRPVRSQHWPAAAGHNVVYGSPFLVFSGASRRGIRLRTTNRIKESFSSADLAYTGAPKWLGCEHFFDEGLEGNSFKNKQETREGSARRYKCGEEPAETRYFRDGCSRYRYSGDIDIDVWPNLG
jgi:hypothetical protein